jgi:hypothetical protein
MGRGEPIRRIAWRITGIAAVAGSILCVAQAGAATAAAPTFCTPAVLLDVKTAMRTVCGAMSIDLPKNWAIVDDRDEGFLFVAWNNRSLSPAALRFSVKPHCGCASIDELLRRAKSLATTGVTVSKVSSPAGPAVRVESDAADGFTTVYAFLHAGTLYTVTLQGRVHNVADRALTKRIAASIRFGPDDRAEQTSHIAYALAWQLEDTTSFAHGTFKVAFSQLRFGDGSWHAHASIDNSTGVPLQIDGIALLRYPDTSDRYAANGADLSSAGRLSPTPPGWSSASIGGVLPVGAAWAGILSGADGATSGDVVRLAVFYRRAGAPDAQSHIWVSPQYLRVPRSATPPA